MRQHIFAPAEMLHSDFFRMDLIYDNVAEGCDPLRDEHGTSIAWKKKIYSYPPIGSPDGGANVTANDLDRFVRKVKAGTLLSPQSTAAFFTPQVLHHVRDDWRYTMGSGMEFAVDVDGKVIFTQKEGTNAGVSAVLLHYPDQDINVVILANIHHVAWEPISTIHRFLKEA